MEGRNWEVSKKRGYLLESLSEEIAEKYGISDNKIIKTALNNSLRNMENKKYETTKFRILVSSNEFKEELKNSIKIEDFY